MAVVALRSRPPEDASLVDAARRGDRDAFARLFESYGPMVHGILLTRVGQTDADDLVQDVFVTALERLAQLADGQAVGPWLAAIARNRAIDFLRRQPRVVELPEDLATTDPRRAEVAQVLEAIRSLPEAYQEPLMLRLVEGMTGAEIAERCGYTPESVRVNLHRGMQKLREALGIEVERE